MGADEKIVEEGFETARHYLDMIVKEPATAVGGLLSDNVNYWRWKNKINILLKAKAFLDKKGIDPKQVLPSTVIPLIEASADVDDETLSGMFAGLLASHISSTNPNEVHPSYTKILGELSPLDAKIISSLFLSVKEQAGYRKLGYKMEVAIKNFGEPESVLILVFENLWRLGLCDRGDDTLSHMNRLKQIVFTDYGFHFMQKCSPK
jgi:hypothetical protein